MNESDSSAELATAIADFIAKEVMLRDGIEPAAVVSLLLAHTFSWAQWVGLSSGELKALCDDAVEACPDRAGGGPGRVWRSSSRKRRKPK